MPPTDATSWPADLLDRLGAIPGSTEVHARPDGLWMSAPALDVPAMGREMTALGFRLCTMTGLPADGGETTVIYHWVRADHAARAVHLKTRTRGGALPSLAHDGAAGLVERARDPRLLRRHVHGSSQSRPAAAAGLAEGGLLPRRSGGRRPRGGMRSTRCRTRFRIGPYHPALEEPYKVSVTCGGERVQDVRVEVGFSFRGIELLAQRRNWVQDVTLIERVCGICSNVHALTFCNAAEAIAGIEVPPRARYIRTIMYELERMHSHLLWAGAAARVHRLPHALHGDVRAAGARDGPARGRSPATGCSTG